MPQPKRYRPFANSFQSMDWEESNCVRCTKYSDDASACPLMYAMALACINDGTVDEDTARSIGYLKENGRTEGRYAWPCVEVIWTEEWKAEWSARYGR